MDTLQADVKNAKEMTKLYNKLINLCADNDLTIEETMLVLCRMLVVATVASDNDLGGVVAMLLFIHRQEFECPKEEMH